MYELYGHYGTFPDGTINAIDLPPDVREQLYRYVDVEGILSNAVGPVYGNYVNFAGYKVNVKIIEATDKTYKVKLV